jgi:hypothetical protein
MEPSPGGLSLAPAKRRVVLGRRAASIAKILNVLIAPLSARMSHDQVSHDSRGTLAGATILNYLQNLCSWRTRAATSFSNDRLIRPNEKGRATSRTASAWSTIHNESHPRHGPSPTLAYLVTMVRSYLSSLTLAALLWGGDSALRRSGQGDRASEQQQGATANADVGKLLTVNENDPVDPDVGGDSGSPQGQLQRAAQQGYPSLDVLGNNGSPASVYPLGLCQGDCDDDDDCEGDLVCFQRSAGGGGVPGCQGSDSKGLDYCVNPQAPNGDTQDDYNQDDGSGNNVNPTTSYIDPAGDSLFKMHWEPNYFWQEEEAERRWCIQCNGNDPGSWARIVDCDSGDATRLLFERQSSSNDFRIRVSGGDLCLRLPVSNMDYSNFERCDDSDEQLWRGSSGNAFGSGPFQISPATQPGNCLTQTHHPKRHERLWVATCEYAEDNDTSLWGRYEINS